MADPTPSRFPVPTPKRGKRFTETLRGIELRAVEGPVTLGELLVLCGPQGHGFLAIFLVLPFLQPIPLPGISSAIGILLIILGVFVALRRPPWVPQRLARVTVQPEAVLMICAKIEKLLLALEHVVKPRMQWLFARRWFRVTNGVVWILHALVFSLPLPIPFTNAFPALVILLMALGILEEDFGVIVVAYLGGVFNILFFGGLIALPTLGWRVLSS
ncbi:MAG: exopolysaccharide biosynthesis protein [Candidatus Binatia bacterium]